MSKAVSHPIPMALSIILLYLLPGVEIVTAQEEEATGQPAPSSIESIKSPPQGFRNIELGMDIEQVKELLFQDPYFDYRGEPDVSFLPDSFDSLIECSGNSYIERAYFQFHQKKLYIMTLLLNRESIDHYTVFTHLSERYGDFTSLDPSKVSWDFENIVLTLERPLSLKYIDKIVFNELRENGKAEADLRVRSRSRFLEDF